MEAPLLTVSVGSNTTPDMAVLPQWVGVGYCVTHNAFIVIWRQSVVTTKI